MGVFRIDRHTIDADRNDGATAVDDQRRRTLHSRPQIRTRSGRSIDLLARSQRVVESDSAAQLPCTEGTGESIVDPDRSRDQIVLTFEQQLDAAFAAPARKRTLELQ